MKFPFKLIRNKPTAEIFGRVEPRIGFMHGLRMRLDGMLGKNITSDLSIPDFVLSKELFWASQFASEKVKKMILGAVFAKPIVNTSAAFSIGEPYKIKVKGDDPKKEETVEKVNAFLRDNYDDMFKWVRNAYRDGDSHIRIYRDGTLERIPPETVEIITNENDINDIIGYDIKQTTEQDGKKITFIESLRTISPFRKVEKFIGNSKNGTAVEGTEEIGKEGEERRLPLIPIYNEKEARGLHGYSEYQNLYHLFSQYTRILASATDDFVYNSKTLLTLAGIDDINKFMTDNFETNDAGEAVLDMDEKTVLLGGAGFEAKAVKGDIAADKAQILLGIYFYLIVQGSETPEFILGGAVQSSKASVSEQLPVVVKKANRNQAQLSGPMKDFINTYIEIAQGFDSSIVQLDDYILIEPSIVDDDKTLNLKIIDTLSKLGLVSDKLAYELAGIIVDDIDEEIENAKADQISKNEANDIFANNPQAQKDALEKEMEAQKELDKKEEVLKKEQKEIEKQKGEIKDKIQEITKDQKKVAVSKIEIKKDKNKVKKILKKVKKV